MKEKEDLLNGNLLRCPRCKKESSVEEFMRLGESKEFESQTVPIYKCPLCKWIFALAVPEDFQRKLLDLLSSKDIVPEQEVERK